MKKLCCCFLIITLLFSSCTYDVNTQSVLQESNATLVVCGNNIPGDYYARINYEDETEEFPLVVVAKAIGATIKQQSSQVIDLIFEDTTYRLNLKKATLIDKNTRKNILMISPGASDPELKVVVENDVIVNTSTAIWFLQLRKMILFVDYENAEIHIEPRPDD